MREEVHMHDNVVPKGATVTRFGERTNVGKNGVDEKTWAMELGMSMADSEFFNKALQQRHPMEREARIPVRTKLLILAVLTEGISRWTLDSDQLLEGPARSGQYGPKGGGLKTQAARTGQRSK